MQLKEIGTLMETQLKDKLGITGSESMEKFMKMQAGSKKSEGFVDPISFSPYKDEVYGRLRKTSLNQLYEIVGGGTGTDWISFVIPIKIYQVMADAFYDADIGDEILAADIPNFDGGTLNYLWGTIDSMYPVDYAEPGSPPMVQIEPDKAALTPTPFGMDMAISRSLVEDSAFGLVETYVRNAGAAMGFFATAKILKALYAGYDATDNAVAGSSGAITVQQVLAAKGKVENQGGLADKCVVTAPMKTNIFGDTATFNLALLWKQKQVQDYDINGTFEMEWYTRRAVTFNGLYDTPTSKYYALIFEQARGAVRAWKRPLTITNYDEPNEGYVGAAVTARQASAAIHDGRYVSAILET